MTSIAQQVGKVVASTEAVGRVQEFVSAVRLLMLYRSDAFREAERRRLPDRVVEFCKSAATAGSTVVGNWGNPLASFQNLSTAWLQSLNAISVFDALWPSMVQAPPRSTVVAVSTTLTGGPVAEANVKPAGKLSLTASDLDVVKCAAYVAISSELLRSGTPNAISILQTELRTAISRACNQTFLPLLVAGTSVASSGVTATGVRMDLRTLLSLVNYGVDSKLFLITTRTIAGALAVLPDVNGAAAFPTATVAGGSIGGIQIIPCAEVTAGEIILVDASQVAAATEGFVLDTSNQATLEMATPGDSPPSASTFQQSLWQLNLSAVRAERYIGAKVLRSDAVAKITGVAYTGASPQ
jgi:HK97 family phage major capsid protein